MSNKLTFHAAGPEDAEILLRWNLHHAKTYETAMLDWQRVEALLDDKLRQELPHCRVICRNGEKIGYFSLQRRPEYLELDNFWVFPPFQGLWYRLPGAPVLQRRGKKGWASPAAFCVLQK